MRQKSGQTKEPAGDTTREATSDEVTGVRREAVQPKADIAESTLEIRGLLEVASHGRVDAMRLIRVTPAPAPRLGTARVLRDPRRWTRPSDHAPVVPEIVF